LVVFFVRQLLIILNASKSYVIGKIGRGRCGEFDRTNNGAADAAGVANRVNRPTIYRRIRCDVFVDALE
jgi:hypothetical protein